MNIQELIKEGSNVTLSVSLSDLREFALALMDEVRKAEAEKPKTEDREITQKEAARQLDVSLGTLWRWSRRNYLVPYHLGGKTFYKQSQIDELLKRR